MKLTILGNNGPYPCAGGACSGYLLSTETTNVLIDCGTGTLANLSAIMPVYRLDAVILSHLHFDHMSDMLPMIYALQFAPQRKPLPVYRPETPENVADLLNATCYAPHKTEDVQIGDINFSFRAVKHPVETYALRAECEGKALVFTGDTNTCDGLAEFCRGADLLLADAGLSSEAWSEKAPHLSAEECGKLAAQCGAKRLVLTHHNPKFDIESLLNEAAAEFANTTFAHIGSQYTV